MSKVRQVLGRGRRAARRLKGSELDYVIPGEITNDPFYDAIVRVAQTSGVRNLLEIGASGGAGSTEAFVEGIRGVQGDATLHSLEVSKPRYDALVARYADVEFVRCYHASSVTLDDFPTAAEVTESLRLADIAPGFPTKEVLRWLRQDVEYVRKHRVRQAGIRAIKAEHSINVFDAVLIDGSEFTGRAELREVYGARFLLLDDIRTYKNHANFTSLLSDSSYRLLDAQAEVRNGYAVFERQ